MTPKPHPPEMIKFALELRLQEVSCKVIQAHTNMSAAYLGKLFGLHGIKISSDTRKNINKKNRMMHKVPYDFTEHAIKKALEEKFSTKVQKELIDGCVYDFTSREHVFMASNLRHKDYDFHQPAKWAILSSLEDTRRRIAFVNSLEGKVANRLRKLNVETFHVSELNICLPESFS